MSAKRIKTLLEEGAVKFHIFQPSGRAIWTVVGRDDEHWADIELGFCSCKSYYYKKAQAEASDRREEPGILSRLIALMILLGMVLFVFFFDLWISSGEGKSFAVLAAINLLLIALLSLFDALFIDYFILVVWRPAFLRLPAGQPTRAAMSRHIRLQFSAGWIFKVPIAVIAALLSSLLRGRIV